MDPRLAERRKTVMAEQARKSMTRVMWLVGLAVLAGAALWLVQSPWLAIASIDVVGAERADVSGALRSAGVETGRPLLLAPVGAAEDALLEDPWVAEAAVDRFYPDRIEVRVIERRPVAVLATPGGSWMLDAEGVVLDRLEGEEHLPIITVPVPPAVPGEPVDDASVKAAAEFFASLGVARSVGATMEVREGELWLELDRYTVRLGRPIDMPQKAASLEAVLEEGPPVGSLINVIAPTRPTVRPPEWQEPSSEAEAGAEDPETLTDTDPG